MHTYRQRYMSISSQIKCMFCFSTFFSILPIVRMFNSSSKNSAAKGQQRAHPLRSTDMYRRLKVYDSLEERAWTFISTEKTKQVFVWVFP